MPGTTPPSRGQLRPFLAGLLAGLLAGGALASWILLALAQDQQDEQRAEFHRAADQAGMIFVNGQLVPKKASRDPDRLSPEAAAAKKAGDEFVQDLESNRLASAYRSTAAAYQKRVSRKQFDALVEKHPELRNLGTATRQTKIRRRPSGGYAYYCTVHYSPPFSAAKLFNYVLGLVEERSEWRVDEVELDSEKS